MLHQRGVVWCFGEDRDMVSQRSAAPGPSAIAFGPSVVAKRSVDATGVLDDRPFSSRAALRNLDPRALCSPDRQLGAGRDLAGDAADLAVPLASKIVRSRAGPRQPADISCFAIPLLL